MTSLTHRRALITGASSGIGEATALAFAQAGINLVLISRSQAKLESVATTARATGVQVEIYPLDLANLEQIQPAIAQIDQQFGPIDLLVNNAGIGYTNLLSDTSLAHWQTVLNLNLTSVFQCVQGVLPGMRQRGGGLIINIASVAAYQVFPQWGAYCVSKAGLITLSKALAAEERAHGIRVTTIVPGAVNTPLWDGETVQAEFDRSQMLTPDLVAQSILHVASLPASAVIEELSLLPSGGTL